jgi:hypothetical protein
MHSIYVPDIQTMLLTAPGRKIPLMKGIAIEYEVTPEEKQYWDSLNPKEKEKLWRDALAQNKDLRAVIDELI